MIELVLCALLGGSLFLSFVVLGVGHRPKPMPDPLAVEAVAQMVGLEGLSFTHVGSFLDPSDYHLLRSQPSLRVMARQFRKERQELALSWIALLAADLKRLWRFRRFLVQCGVPTNFREETHILFSFASCIFLLQLVKLQIRCFGPFALPGTTRRAKMLVATMSYAPARVLSRVPAADWPEIEQSWSRCAG